MKFDVPSVIFVTCAKAMPPFLAQECRALGFKKVVEDDAGARLSGTLEDAMLLNLRLRTAHRVLYQVAAFKANTADDLYRCVQQTQWEEIIEPTGYFSVMSAVLNESIRDTRFPSLKCKDAIADRIRSATGRRPDSGPDQDKTVVFLYWRENECKLYLDTSGEPLSKRGYRRIPLKAPMQETLAAGVLMSAGWGGKGNLLNPMCGSGTIAIEAALMACRIPAGSIRSNFGFMHIKGFDGNRWKEMRNKAMSESRGAPDARIIASDIDRRAVDAARRNARAAGVDNLIEFSVCDYGQSQVPAGGGLVIVNPEYGERMGEESRLATVYHGIGDFFKQKCAGYMCYVFTGNLSLAKMVGLRSKSRTTFFNSRIECRLLEYEMYEGSRRKENGGSP